MLKHILKSWDELTSRLVFMAGEAEGATFEVETAKEEAKDITEVKEIDLSEVETDKVSDEIVKHFEKHHSPTVYQKWLEGKLKGYKEADKGTLIKDSVSRYKIAYEAALLHLKNANNSHLEVYKEHVASIKKTTHNQIDAVAEAVKRGEKVEAPELDKLGKQMETTKQVTDYAEQLNAQYLNENWQKTQFPDQFDKWNKMAEEFKNGIDTTLKAQVADLYKSTDKPEEIENGLNEIKTKLEQSYKDFANNDGQIDLTNLGAAKRKAEDLMEIHKKIEAGAMNAEVLAEIDPNTLKSRPDNWATTTIEAMNVMLPEGMELEPGNWRSAVDKTVRQLLINAKNDGLEPLIIKFAEQNTDRTTRPTVDEAISKIRERFSQEATKDSEAGLRNASETVELIQKLNLSLNQEQIAHREDIPEQIRGMALHERNMLLGGRTEARTVDDIAVVEFMRGSYAKKKDILRTPKKREDLLQAIANITASKSAYQVDKKILKGRETKDLVHSRNPDTPTNDDITARKLAILTLAKESETIVSNIAETNEFKQLHGDMDLSERKPEKNPPKTNFKLADNLKLYSADYQTLASRNGFNGVELGKAALKTWAVLTLVTNVMSERKNLMDGDFSGLAKNPFIHVSGTALFGLHKINQNPKAGDYFKEGEGGREALGDETALNKIAKKHGKAEVASFVQTPSEFNIMDKLKPKHLEAIYKKSQERIDKTQKASEKAKEKDPKKEVVRLRPAVTAEDMRSLAEDGKLGDIEPEDLNYLKSDARSARIRYDFYKSFAARGKNTRQLYANAKDWI